MRDMHGGCLCGQVRYSANIEPAFVAVCHCRNCQKASGTAFAVIAVVPKQALSVRGALKTFNDRGDSGRALDRRFCPECGSPILYEAEARPDASLIMAGT